MLSLPCFFFFFFCLSNLFILQVYLIIHIPKYKIWCFAKIFNIFRYLNTIKSAECQQICKARHNAAKTIFYSNIHIDSNSTIASMFHSLQLNGLLGKRIHSNTIHFARGYAPDFDLGQLFAYCSNVESVSCVSPNINAVMLRALLELPENNLNKLHFRTRAIYRFHSGSIQEIFRVWSKTSTSWFIPVSYFCSRRCSMLPTHLKNFYRSYS